MKRSFLFAALAFATTGQAEVVFDGTLGPLGQQSGDMVVGEGDGTRVGSNLFHSFEALNVNFGESLLFTSDFAGATDNIVSRVTGSGLSVIDGLLWSDLPGTALWLINPNGLVFGENAIVDVQGSFHASTADYLVLEDGGRFGADLALAENSTLTMANPLAFGFLDNSIGSIEVQGGGMFVPYSETLELVGGDVSIENAFFVADGGSFGLAAVGGPGEVTAGAIAYEGADTWSDIRLADSIVLANGDGGGAVYIRGGQIVMERSMIEAQTYGFEDGRGVHIQGDDVLLTETSEIDTTTFGPGPGGAVDIAASGDVWLQNGSVINSLTASDGDAGDITISAGGAIVLDGADANGTVARIRGATFGNGRGSDIDLTAAEITVANGTYIFNGARNNGDAGDIWLTASDSVNLVGTDANGFSGGIFARSTGPGSSANVVVNTGDYNQLDASYILLTSFGDGNSGNLAIDATGDVTIAGTGLFNDPNRVDLAAVGSGAAGSFTVGAANMYVLDGTQIVTVSENDLAGGAITLDVDGAFEIGGWTEDDFGRFDTSSMRSTSVDGDGGDILISAGDVIVDRGANIRTDSEGGGAGEITIDATGSIRIGGEVDGIDPEIVPGAFITAQSLFNDPLGQQGGNISLNAGNIDILGGSVIATVAFNESGNAGDINITAGQMLNISNTGLFAPVIDSEAAFGATPGNILLSASDIVLSDTYILSDVSFSDAEAGAITVTAGNSILMDNYTSITALDFFGSGGGEIRLSAPDITMRNFANLASDTFGDQGGDAGDIYVNAGSFLMESGAVIDANSCLCASGSAGNIFIDVDTLDILGTGFINVPTGIRSTTLGSGDGGDIVINASEINMTDVAVISAVSLSSEQDFINQGIDGTPGNAGSISITANSLVMSESFIESAAVEAAGGNLTLNISDFLYAQRSSIAASASGVDATSAGGNIFIAEPDFIILERGTISASANAGNGGNIQISTGAIIVTPFSGIDASSQTGIDGSVSVESPNRLVASVTPLEAPVLDVTAFTQDPCEIAVNQDRSSFTAPQSDGIVESPADYQPSPFTLPGVVGDSAWEQICE